MCAEYKYISEHIPVWQSFNHTTKKKRHLIQQAVPLFYFVLFHCLTLHSLAHPLCLSPFNQRLKNKHYQNQKATDLG